jgi:Flp pilus assembly pilin Flp
MPGIRCNFARLLSEGDGTTAIEYAMLLSLGLLGCISAGQALTATMQSAFGSTVEQVSAEMTPSTATKDRGTVRKPEVKIRKSRNVTQP